VFHCTLNVDRSDDQAIMSKLSDLKSLNKQSIVLVRVTCSKLMVALFSRTLQVIEYISEEG
jgi:hypothetical protein